MRWFSIADEAFAGDERRTSKGIKMGGARDEWYEEEKQSLEKFSRLGNKLKTSCKTAQKLGKTMEGSVMAGKGKGPRQIANGVKIRMQKQSRPRERSGKKMRWRGDGMPRGRKRELTEGYLVVDGHLARFDAVDCRTMGVSRVDRRSWQTLEGEKKPIYFRRLIVWPTIKTRRANICTRGGRGQGRLTVLVYFIESRLETPQRIELGADPLRESAHSLVLDVPQEMLHANFLGLLGANLGRKVLERATSGSSVLTSSITWSTVCWAANQKHRARYQRHRLPRET